MIVGTGASVKDHDLTRVTCPVMTTNIAWSRRWMPDFHVAIDHAQYLAYPAIYEDLHQHGRLYVAGSKWNVGHRLAFRTDGVLYSPDITRGVVESMDGCGSVLYVALQIAEHLGFGPLYLVGLDLHGPRFDGSKAFDGIEKQNKLFLHAAAVSHAKIFNAGSPQTRCTAFPLVDFSAVPQSEPAVTVKAQADMAAPQ